MWYTKNFFKYLISTLLFLLITLIIQQLSPLLFPILNFLITLILPLLFGGFLYYILRPTRDFLEKKNVSRNKAITLIFFSLIFILLLFGLYIWPLITDQLIQFSESPIEKIEEKTLDVMNFLHLNNYSTTEIRRSLSEFLHIGMEWIKADIISIVSQATRIASLIIFTPFILFYLLRDSEQLPNNIIKLTPLEYKSTISTIISDVDQTLSTYISGQFLIALILGALTFIGYLIIGLNYAFFLALLVTIFTLIPCIGSLISTIPALIVGILTSPIMGLKVIIVIALVHTLDNYLISPHIIGYRLNIHPLTIILLLLASGTLYGITGLFLATPLYAILRIILSDLYKVEINNKQPP